MANVLKELSRHLPGIKFEATTSFYWSPATKTVFYAPKEIKHESGIWALLHEASHATLSHCSYFTDLELLMLEVAAWDEAQRLGKLLGIVIDPEHIEDCLDTYRDWLHQRSTCPTCGVVSLQESPNMYRCFNCLSDWQVSTSRFCRPYRLSKYGAKKKTPPVTPPVPATFLKKI